MSRLVYAAKRICTLVQCEAILIFTVGLVALLGHLYSHPSMVALDGPMPMSVSTAICFIACACALWGLASMLERMDKTISSFPCAKDVDEMDKVLRRLEVIEQKLNLIEP